MIKAEIKFRNETYIKLKSIKNVFSNKREIKYV